LHLEKKNLVDQKNSELDFGRAEIQIKSSSESTTQLAKIVWWLRLWFSCSCTIYTFLFLKPFLLHSLLVVVVGGGEVLWWFDDGLEILSFSFLFMIKINFKWMLINFPTFATFQFVCLEVENFDVHVGVDGSGKNER
jgi:hypothetical protein